MLSGYVKSLEFLVHIRPLFLVHEARRGERKRSEAKLERGKTSLSLGTIALIGLRTSPASLPRPSSLLLASYQLAYLGVTIQIRTMYCFQ